MTKAQQSTASSGLDWAGLRVLASYWTGRSNLRQTPLFIWRKKAHASSHRLELRFADGTVGERERRPRDAQDSTATAHGLSVELLSRHKKQSMSTPKVIGLTGETAAPPCVPRPRARLSALSHPTTSLVGAITSRGMYTM